MIDVALRRVITSGLWIPLAPLARRSSLAARIGDGSVGLSPKLERATRSPRCPASPRVDFLGRFAFVGLSQVRETAEFSGIPITEQPTERCCGVWVIDIVTGKTVAFLRFEDALQEIFAVQVLPGRRFPDLVNDDQTLLDSSFVLPDEALSDVPDRCEAWPECGGCRRAPTAARIVARKSVSTLQPKLTDRQLIPDEVRQWHLRIHSAAGSSFRNDIKKLRAFRSTLESVETRTLLSGSLHSSTHSATPAPARASTATCGKSSPKPTATPAAHRLRRDGHASTVEGSAGHHREHDDQPPR